MRKITAAFLILFSASFLAAEISVTPYGGAGTVSGSCFLFEAEGKKTLVDCGLFMEENEEMYSNSNMPQELSGADFVVLTHAHLDHSGRIPLLVSKGFNGKIYSTPATKELALELFKERNGFNVIEKKWFWSGVQREKAENNNSTAVAHWDEDCKENIKTIEYSERTETLERLRQDTGVTFLACKRCCAKDSAAIEKLFHTLNYEETAEISENLKIKFINAGHIPGSASVIFYADGKKVLFSGDIGSGYSRLNGEFSVPESADMVFMEATYADAKALPDFKDYDVFRDDLLKAVGKGNIVWIPSLAFNRTQKVLYELRLMQKNGMLPNNFPIYSVSPSANKITKIYQKEIKNNNHGDWFLQDIYGEGKILPDSAKQSKNVKFDAPLIVISSSGDMDKGMSARYASSLLPRKDVSVMIVNYVKPESTAGLLLSGKSKIKGIKRGVSVKKYDIFSDHAGFDMLQKWLSRQDKKTAVYLIHSERKSADEMKRLLKKKGWENVSAAVLTGKIVLGQQ